MNEIVLEEQIKNKEYLKMKLIDFDVLVTF